MVVEPLLRLVADEELGQEQLARGEIGLAVVRRRGARVAHVGIGEDHEYVAEEVGERAAPFVLRARLVHERDGHPVLGDDRAAEEERQRGEAHRDPEPLGERLKRHRGLLDRRLTQRVVGYALVV